MAEKEMHKAVCADCGKECEVPFKPDTSRPVYCRECWSKRRTQRRRFQVKLTALIQQLLFLYFSILQCKRYINFANQSLNSHLHHKSLGCLSGGQTKQFTSTFGFSVFAKFFKQPKRTFLHGNSHNPLLKRASCVLHLSTLKVARLSLISTVLKGWSKAQLDLRKSSIIVGTSGFSLT